MDILDSKLVSELRRMELRTRRSIDSDLMGRYRSAFRGSGLVFDEVREYQPGDDVKKIHWKVTARSGEVYVKSYTEDRQLTVILAVDISSSTLFGGTKTKYRRALEFSALISMLARQNQDRIGLCLFSDQVEEYIPPGKSRAQFQRILLALMAKRTLRKGTNVAAALNYVNQRQRRASIIFVVSDFLCAPYEQELRHLSYRHDVISVLIEDEVDERMPSAGIVEFEDAESGKRILIDTSSAAARTVLQSMHARRVQEIRDCCKASATDFIAVRDNPLRPLAQLMDWRTSRIR